MDKVYNHKEVEGDIYQKWEEQGYFKPEINPKGKPYTIILPPPNANAPLHFGHAMYVIEDILIRYHRMKGEAALWLPGADHAGFETQFVFEKKLQKEGKSRFDFDRDELYKMIWDYVQKNREGTENQLRKLGFSLDWTRKKFTLDSDIIKIVYKTFKKLFDDGLLYRGDRLVNYCTKCGTSFSDLEVNHKEQKDSLYYLKYGPFILATVRPETVFGDTAVAVNTKDEKHKNWVGKEIEVQGVLGKFKVKVIADDVIDPNFGTGVAKVTPAHDMKDFEMGKRHNLNVVRIIDFDGKLNEKAGKYKGLYVKQARKIVAEDMQKMGLIEKIDENYTHTIEVCYKCGTTIEPMLLPQWFIRMESLAKPAIDAVKKGEIKIYPQRFEKTYLDFLENIRDWNISRQIVWGIRIPAWQCQDCSKWVVTAGEAPNNCSKCKSKNLEQDGDTFDTWFSSAQWPFATLQATKSENFYPTSVMETGYDILRWWVARMVMVGIYVTGKVPFKNIVLHGLVNDPLGKKMSKSKGNVIDPLELVEQYGADAVRFALVYGTAFGNDQSLSYPKLEAARKFTNKLWNMARFIEMKKIRINDEGLMMKDLENMAKNENDKEMVKKTKQLSKELTNNIDSYQFNYAAEALYEFVWHEFADKYIEDVKNRINQNSSLILNSLFIILLKLLHPFMPFITEEIYKRLTNSNRSIMIESWPQ
ncbi:MAG: valine--tRNA ligase [Candidatus Levybacteria bacterium]|nr:valine--tRNA ligase [Candidatus Levybacteria bacterium]